MPNAGKEGLVPEDENDYLDDQEVSEKLDVASCWRVIAQQSDMIKAQQILLKEMAEDIRSLREEMGKGAPKSPKDDSKLSVEDVAKMMDRRGSPPPAPFDLSVGGSFADFMVQFEAYCRGKYSPTTYDRWTGELENFLRGEILQIYKIWGGGILTLTEMKLKLSSFCENEQGKDLGAKIAKFELATPEADELLHIYAYRLERLYLAAHPGTNTDTCIELQTKLLTTLPAKCREEIERGIDQQKITFDKSIISWEKIVKMLKCYAERNPVGSKIPSNHIVKGDPIWFTSSNVYGSNRTNQSNIERQSRSRQRTNNQRHYRSQSFNRAPQRQPVFNNNFKSNWNNNGNNNNGYGNFYNGPFRKFSKPTCNFCGLPGHEEKVCWRRLGCCVRCGTQGHYARDCPQPRRQRRPTYQPGNNYNQNGQQSTQYNNNHLGNLNQGHQIWNQTNQNNQQWYPRNQGGQQRNTGVQSFYNNRTLSLDRQNYLLNTPLNPGTPAWTPQGNLTSQDDSQIPSSLNQQASA